MNPLQGLYLLGLRLDRALSKRVKLNSIVISIGNIAVGGRAKTPLVIAVCKILKEKGLHPVVLTRGYARKSKDDVWLLPETLASLQKLSVDESGDEAIEIFIKAQVPVLISAQRAEQAQKYLQQNKDQKFVFVLDDGFQHWRLERDMDVVVVSERDFVDTLLPTGRLRESPESLKRADLVFHLEEDIHKVIEISMSGYDPAFCMAVTTRAGSQKKYQEQLSQQLGFTVPILSLRDHLNADALREQLCTLAPEIKYLILGMKEAVKLLSPSELQTKKSLYPLTLKGRDFSVVLCDLNLDWNKLAFENSLKQKGII